MSNEMTDIQKAIEEAETVLKAAERSANMTGVVVLVVMLLLGLSIFTNAVLAVVIWGMQG